MNCCGRTRPKNFTSKRKRYKCRYGRYCRSKWDPLHTRKYYHPDEKIRHSSPENNPYFERKSKYLKNQKKSLGSIYKRKSITRRSNSAAKSRPNASFTFSAYKEQNKMKPSNHQRKTVRKRFKTPTPLKRTYATLDHLPIPFFDQRTWKTIKDQSQITSFPDLVKFMEKIAGKGAKEFVILKEAIIEFGEKTFFVELLPFLLKLLKHTENEFIGITKFQFLLQKKNDSLFLTKRRIAILLCNAFFSTFQFNNHHFGQIGKEEQNINFKRFFNHRYEEFLVSKAVFFLHYFHRTLKDNWKMNQNKLICIERICKFADFDKIKNSNQRISLCRLNNKGKIEDCMDARQVDFGNKCIGGGVLRRGSVQEEILFCIKPECLVAKLLCPSLLSNEAIVIKGIEQYAKYSGYSRSLKFKGNFIDANVGKYEIVAINATDFSANESLQFQEKYIKKEIWKSTVGFSKSNFKKIATGHWGCGAFGGNKELKFVIQLISASFNELEFCYYVFGDSKLTSKFKTFLTFLKTKKVTVSELYCAVLRIGTKKNFGIRCNLEFLRKFINTQRRHKKLNPKKNLKKKEFAYPKGYIFDNNLESLYE